MRCVDCGATDIKPVTSSRGDVCDECFENRKALISSAASGGISPSDFQDIQHHKYSRKEKMVALGIVKNPSLLGEDTGNKEK